MILQKEIINTAHAKNVKTKTIDKDWILGHFLNAMYSFEEVQENFVFKGGTCLKKCYFEDYRFSEDLDFTLLDENFVVDAKFISKIIKQAELTSGAKFYFERKKMQKSKDAEQGYEIKVKFWGADHKQNQRPLPPSRWQTYIKLDISFSERLLTKPVMKPIFHNYTDSEILNQIVTAYSLYEVISEKLRSLIQRNRPRDIYDIWTLVNFFGKSEYKTIKELLHEKLKDKSINITGINDFVNSDKSRKNKRAWSSSLGDHLPENKLPDFDDVYKSIKIFIEKILNS
jgi:predicted nucleotidyltransferase component of viral defense system